MEDQFIKHIQEHTGIIHKILNLYVDTSEDRRDLHQEILLQAWKSYGRFRRDAKFSTWLYRIGLNTALTYRKKEEKRISAVQNAKLDNESNQEKHELLYLIIKQLKEVDRMLITLHLDGYKNREISEITGINVNNVNVKIHRIKNLIIEKFKNESNGHI